MPILASGRHSRWSATEGGCRQVRRPTKFAVSTAHGGQGGTAAQHAMVEFLGCRVLPMNRSRGHVAGRTALSPRADLRAATSAFQAVPSTSPPGADVISAGAYGPVLTRRRHSSNYVRLGLKWYIPLVEWHCLNGHLATLLLIGGSDLMYCAIALRSSPLRWLNPSSIASAMRPSAAS